MADDSTSPSPFPEVRRTVRVSAEPALIEEISYYRGKTGGYVVERTSILSIIDRTGREFKPRWDADWSELAPGIEMRSENKGTRATIGNHKHETHISASLRIHPHACPVYVKFLKTSEYNDYDDDSFSNNQTDAYWVCYETEEQMKEER